VLNRVEGSVLQTTLKKFVRARLSREGVFGLHLTVGVLALVTGTWVFARLAEGIGNGGPWTATDVRFSLWLQRHATPLLTTPLYLVTELHSMPGVSVMAVAIALYLMRRGLRQWAITFLVTVYSGMLLNMILKLVFQRARPHFEGAILALGGYSFPSGHTMTATVFYGTLSAIIVTQTHRWRRRLLAIAGATSLIVLVGLSRIYLGVHYLSDVLGAMAEGLGWLAICLTAMTMRRSEPNENPIADC
jgi:membrane-associated phospholipid phosphatase